MKNNGTIELEGMEFRAFHGCLEHERREGNLFTVDFRTDLDISRAAESDRLEDTLDYGAVYGIIAAEMAQPSDLLEHVAGRIAKAISGAFPWIDDFSIRVSKRNPPVSGPAAWSRVTLRHSAGCQGMMSGISGLHPGRKETSKDNMEASTAKGKRQQ